MAYEDDQQKEQTEQDIRQAEHDKEHGAVDPGETGTVTDAPQTALEASQERGSEEDGAEYPATHSEGLEEDEAAQDEPEHDEYAPEAPDKADQDEDDKHKVNDITEGGNRIDTTKEVSHSTLEQALRCIPAPIHRMIGDNEYLLLTERQVGLLSESAQDEINSLHGEHVYELDGDSYIAVPNRTVNTPQPLSGTIGGLSKKTHNDIFAKNVQLEKQRLGIEE